MATIDDIRQALTQVEEPELHKDIVSLKMVKGISIENGKIHISIELTTPACPLKDEIQKRVENAVKALPGVKNISIEMTSRVPEARAVSGKLPIEGVKNVVAVYACKGGVGKSTVASNLAVALSLKGAQVGILDADIYGPNMPIMMGVNMRPQASEKPGKIAPLIAHNTKVMSIGFLMDASTPVIWRGPMVHGAVQQLLRETDWGALDYLVVDLPPGTGDAQLTLIQSVPIAGVVFVTTPQQVSLADSLKGIQMFRKLNVPILGLVENMSGFTCPHCGTVTNIFSKDGGKSEASEFSLPFLGSIPIEPAITAAGDTGVPIVRSHPESASGKAFLHLAELVAANLSVAHFDQSS